MGIFCEWDDDDGGNVFGLNGRDDSFIEVVLEVVVSYFFFVVLMG